MDKSNDVGLNCCRSMHGFWYTILISASNHLPDRYITVTWRCEVLKGWREGYRVIVVYFVFHPTKNFSFIPEVIWSWFGININFRDLVSVVWVIWDEPNLKLIGSSSFYFVCMRDALICDKFLLARVGLVSPLIGHVLWYPPPLWHWRLYFVKQQ